MKKILLCLFILLSATIQAQKIKVACVGNSVTYGHGIEDREKNSYPTQLQRMLGERYEVVNFGKSGATLLRRGHCPYNEQEEYKAALDFAADQVVIHLGLNDTDPRDWPNYRDDFTKDYLALIDAFRQANPKCKIWICRLTPISHRHTRFKSGTRDWYWQIQQNIEDIATLANTGLIDLQAGLYDRPDLLPDALHPTAEGAGIIARTVCQALTGDYGGLQMPMTYSDNMVLQREKPLRIAGTANAGEKVTVDIAGQKGEAVTAPDGKWSVTLPPMKAGGPYTLSISAASGKLDYTNVLIGEVWLCSGQSNMAFQVSSAVDSQRKAFLEFAARKPQIRLFDMKPRWATSAVEWDISTLDSLNRLQYYRDTEWKECNEETANRFSAVAFAFGQMLSDSLQVPVGLILNAIGGSPTEAWIDRRTLEFEFPDILYDWKQNDFIQGWARERAALNIRKSANKQQRHPYEPCYLYESGIRPLEKFPIRGVIWYQGESNAHNMEAHERLFHLLTKNWRENWAEELPFYYVQLSSIDRPSWPWFRDSQRRMLRSIPNSGMAVSSDHGDSLDVHPRHKREIGERLAHWALNKTYGHEVLPSGPLYRSVKFKDGAAYITFDYGKGMHSSDGGELRTFEVAGHDGSFVPAEAQIIDGKTVKIWSDQIQNPRFVRYGWQPFTRANLVNEAGLPASTFRSEASPVSWFRLPDLPGTEKSPSSGVSAPFTGINGGQLLVAGGCNFPDKPAAEGGTKEYYSDIYALDITARSPAGWRRIGKLPMPLAYGASVTTPEGLVWIGGNNNEEVSGQVFSISWNTERQMPDISKLPALPVPMDNLAAAYADGCLYVAGGNKQAEYANSLFCLQFASPTGKQWIRLPDFPGPARIQPVLAAQKSPDGTRLYLAGGYQPVSGYRGAIVSTDLLSYHIETKRWKNEGFLPVSEDGSPYTATGGCIVSSGDSSLLLAGGVNYSRFSDALDRPLRTKQAASAGNFALRDSLLNETRNYLSQPTEWYKFNSSLLLYNTFTRRWTSLGNYEEPARAGAGIAQHGNTVILIGGELKPGIRTSEVNAFEIFPELYQTAK
ncbi:MAG: cyclically-permuted mutarotase family protein [Parabacteroides johnsonii]